MRHDIVSTLMRLGPAAAEEIAQDLGVSQPTVSRLISAHAGRVIRVGGSKNTIYGAARKIRQLPESEIPVFSIDEAGNPGLFGSIAAVHPQGFLWTGAGGEWPVEKRSKLYFHSIPYFIHDVRPQGFMGRNFARLNSAVLGVPDNPERWLDDDILVVISMMGDDLSGNLIVGEASYRRFVERKLDVVGEAEINETYLDLAQRSVSSGIAGSSAAGEFPKFTAIRERDGKIQHVIVKFSGSGNSDAEQRWSDLLRCEVHASVVARTHLGIESAESMAFAFGGRTFMETVRFDRIGVKGRRAMCSLASLDSELIGIGDPAWDKFADKLLEVRVIDAESARAMRKAWYFGKLIGNTDMHAGNLSFRLTAAGKVVLCPLYDMLPMCYAPLRGGEVPEIGHEKLYVPLPGHEDEFNVALTSALEFWNSVVGDDAISVGFRQIAECWLNLLVPKDRNL